MNDGCSVSTLNKNLLTKKLSASTKKNYKNMIDVKAM